MTRAAPGIVVCALVATASLGCGRSCANQGTEPDASSSVTSGPLPELDAVVLAKGQVRPNGIALDGTHVYFRPFSGGVRRVSRTPDAGAVEELDTSAFPPPGARMDPARAYYNGHGPEPRRTALLDGYAYELDASGVYRVPERGARSMLARSFDAGNIARKVLVVDDARVYWVEPAAGAIFSVPKGGGATSLICEVGVALHEDLALAAGRLYVLSIGGALRSAPVSSTGGGACVTHAFDSSGGLLGANRNGVWMFAEGGFLYVTSDALGYAKTPQQAPVAIELGKPIDLSNLPEQDFDGRVVRIAAPREGRAYEPSGEGLVFPTNVYFDAKGLAVGDMARLSQTIKPFTAELARGKIELVVSIPAGPDLDAATPGVRGASALEAWLHEHVHPSTRLRTRPRPSPRSPGSNAREGTDAQLVVGFEARDLPVLFAPPTPTRDE